MRIVDVRQQTEEWDRWRARPTASEFGKFCTPAGGQYSAQATAYACKIVAKRLGVYVEPPPSFAMDWGVEMEPNARHAYCEQMRCEVQEVGFILPDNTDAYGGSPDGLVGDDGLLEIKCPQPETLIAWHAEGVLPVQYKPQVQGLLMISQRNWLDFWGFHPELEPFLLRVLPDEKYQTHIAEGLLTLLEEIDRIESLVHRKHHQLISPVLSNVRWND